MAKWLIDPPQTMLTPETIESSRIKELKGLDLLYSEKNPNFKKDFFAKTEKEVDQIHNAHVKYINSMYILEIIACCESYFRYEYMHRCLCKLKDPLSKELRKLYKKKAEKAHFGDDLVKVWKDYLDCSNGEVNQFLEVLRYRDWLAHGRYWPLKGSLQQKFNYQSIYTLCYALIESIRKFSTVTYSTLLME